MKLRARRGAVVVLLGIMMVALMSVSAISIDFSRMWTLRNELQTVADAAAHAGALQLLPPNNAGTTVAVTTAYAGVNTAMQGSATVDSVVLGDWDDAARTFTPAALVTDAVNVVVSRQATGLVMGLLGVAQPRIKARAIGWAAAPVTTLAQSCLLPLAVPYTQLMTRINAYRGIANTPDTNGMYRPFDPVADLDALNNMTVAQRTFSLKIGSGSINDPVGAMSGNYQAVQLPAVWSAATQAPTNPGPQSGASAYRDNMSCAVTNTLAVGDSLETEPGNMTNPTVCGAWPGAQGCGTVTGPGICDVIRGDQADPANTPQTSSNFGNCEDANGNVGVDVMAGFYRCTTGCNGRTRVGVDLVGSFSLTKVFPDKSKKNAYTTFDKSEIVGIFKPFTNTGSVGSGSTTLTRPIIVR